MGEVSGRIADGNTGWQGYASVMAHSYQDMLAAARAEVDEITPDDTDVRTTSTLIDVREPDEWSQGAIPGAVLIPRGTLEYTIGTKVPDLTTPLVVYCAGGQRSLLAAKVLKDFGYVDVVSLAGGFTRWRAEGREWRTPEGLSGDQRARYARHLILGGVGEAGQKKLLAAKVLVIGAGGLGSPAALYLAAAGVGTIGIVDFDVVDASNLQRQVLHNTRTVGHLKVDSARDTLTALNPDVKVEPYAERLTSKNALELMLGYDVVVDGGDKLPDALSRQRRLTPSPDTGGPRFDLPLRGPGHGVHSLRRAVLSLSVPQPASARTCTQLCRGRRARRASRCHRVPSRRRKP